MKKDTFGINMKAWCAEHEEKLRTEPPTEELLEEHKEKIAWLQHERFVHLIVTMMVVLVELFVLAVVLISQNVFAAAILIGLAILLGFYFCHYFFLENTVQRWYKMTDDLCIKLQQSRQ